MGQRFALLAAFTSCLACEGQSAEAPQPEPPRVVTSASGPGVAAEPPAPAPRPLDTSRYPWLAQPTADTPEVVDDLESRFPTPKGFRRVKAVPDSLGGWLRNLPLAAAGTPVRRFNGTVLHPPNHPNIAAVAAIDTGKQDLQQCADVIIRLHAEHSWSQGNRDHSYRSAAGLPLPYQRFARGERVRSSGASIRWQASTRPDTGRRGFRQYLSTVFAWTNTVALRRQTTAVKSDEVRPGDFFIQGGNPGHAVLVLEVVVAADGSRRMLLGQSFMPAQSLQVLRRRGADAWYPVDPERALKTPFWRPFEWSDLHRFDS